MNGEINLKDILDYIDNDITDNNHKDQYIFYLTLIHNLFLNRDGIDFGFRYNVLKQANLIITELINHENGELRDEWIELRSLIVPGLIKEDKNLCDDDRYFNPGIRLENKNEDKYKYKLPVFVQNSSLINDE